MSEKKTIYLMDASAFIHRAFHALYTLTTSDGRPTGAIFGFVNTLTKLMKDKFPSYLGIAFDGKSSSDRRKKIYKEYKANRPPMDEDLRFQIEPIHKLVEAFGFKSLSADGHEADDLIAVYTRKFQNEGIDVVIVSGDKDFYQLLSERVSMYDPDSSKKSALTIEGFNERFPGISPREFLEMQALMGDSSDNIPGVKKVGEKTALKLIAQYHDLDKLYENVRFVKSVPIRDSLIENKDSAYISRELAYLGGDLDSPLDLSDFVPKSMDKDKLRSYFREFELQRFLAALDLAEAFPKADTDKKESAKGHDSHPGPDSHAGHAGSAGHDAKGQISHKEGQVDYARYLLVQSDDDMENLTKALKDAKKIALDLETDSKDASVANIVGISLSTSENIAFYIPIDHSALKEGEVNLDLDLTLNILEKYLLSKDKELYGQNAKYDWLILARHNLVLPEPKGDPMLASYLYDPDSGHDMDRLSAQFLGHNTITYKEVVPDKKMTFRDVSLVDATRYSGEDSDVTLRLSKILDEKLKEDRALSLLYQHIELPLEYVLVFMEAAGILVDKEVLKEVSKSLASEMKDLESDIFKLAGSEFNLSSPRQVGKVLFEDLKLKPVKRTSKTKSYSTDVEVLTELSISEPIAQKLLNYRELDKLKSNYADKLAKYINPKTHRIHTSFNQTRAVTGRLSSSEPNLQTIPAKTENGRRIREAFMAGEGNVLISADYSQIELRVMAEFSKDSALIEAFKNDEDIHRETAAKVFGINPQDVSPEERQRAKAINFGIIYGQSATGLGKILKIDTKEAASFISLYFTRFPGVKAFMDEAIERARHTQKATTLFGRRRFLPNILLMDHSIRGEAERMAINTPIQGTAADLIKIAMIKVHNRFIKDKLKGRILLQVHDELIVEAPEDEAEKVKDILVEEMAAAGSKEFFPGAPVLSVPLKVDCSVSKRWSHA